jgi:4-hydroxythreonine-4-phosphate dehydrogenase
VIGPALAQLKKKGAVIDGPLPADTACNLARQGAYDAVIAMYHDQALIPLKLTGADSGVNFTAGLPFVRTSPLHGTAFDIAGKGRASPDSFIAAFETCRTCCQNLRKA